MLAWLQLSNRWESLRDAFEHERTAADLATARGLGVSPEDVQTAVDAWRKARGLEDPQAFGAWLAEHGLSLEDLEEHVSSSLLRDALERSLSGDDLCAYARDQGGALDAIRLSLIEAPTAAAARAILERVERGEAFESVAREASSDSGSGSEGGALGWVFQRDVPGAFRPLLSRGTLGEALGPLAYQGRWYLLRRDEGPLPAPPHMLEPLRREVAADLIEKAR